MKSFGRMATFFVRMRMDQKKSTFGDPGIYIYIYICAFLTYYPMSLSGGRTSTYEWCLDTQPHFFLPGPAWHWVHHPDEWQFNRIKWRWPRALFVCFLMVFLLCLYMFLIAFMFFQVVGVSPFSFDNV